MDILTDKLKVKLLTEDTDIETVYYSVEYNGEHIFMMYYNTEECVFETELGTKFSNIYHAVKVSIDTKLEEAKKEVSKYEELRKEYDNYI